VDSPFLPKGEILKIAVYFCILLYYNIYQRYFQYKNVNYGEDMNKPYILSPAGSYDALVAAVNAGADEVYFGFGEFNARQNAENFTDEKLKTAIEKCRLLGVKTNITVNTLVTDREIKSVLDIVYKGACLGADAFIVQDLGLASQIKKQMPEVCLHASTQCACHNSEGAKRLGELGFSRVVLAREMPEDEIQKVVRLGIETEIFVHGALCVCHSGMCLMSSVIGKRSGNRGLCAQPCRLAYSLDGQNAPSYPLSLKDSCLGTRVEDIIKLGVTSLKIEGRMKSPDYVYNTTKIWREILDGEKNASKEQIKRLENVFSRGGFTDKYFTGEYVNSNKDMYGIRSELDKQNTRQAEKQTQAVEERKRSITIDCTITEGEKASITAAAGDVTVSCQSDFICAGAKDRPLDKTEAENSLSKLGATSFYSKKTNVNINGSVFLPKSQLNMLRRNVIAALEEQLTKPPVIERYDADGTFAERRKRVTAMELFASCISFKTASKQKNISCVSVPIEEFLDFDEDKKALLCGIISSGKKVGVRLPRVIFDSEKGELCRLVEKAKNNGVVFAEISNIGHIDCAREAGLELYGSVGMNVFNSYTVSVLEKLGFSLVCASPELNEAQIRDLSVSENTKLCAFVKGRLPLMILESCIVKAQKRCMDCNGEGCDVLTDRIGKQFKIFGEKRLNKEHGYKPCRNIIVNSVEADILSSKEKVQKMNVDTGLVYIWE